jgi:hypothetical protein
MSGLEERRLKKLESDLKRLEFRLTAQDEDVLYRSTRHATVLVSGTEGERGDGRDENDHNDDYDGNTTMHYVGVEDESTAHDAIHSAILRLSSRIATLEAVTTLTTVSIIGTVSRLWTESLLFVAMSGIYDESKARSVAIATGFVGFPGSIFARDENLRHYTPAEEEMYWGREYNKIHGQRNPDLDHPRFNGSGREGVGFGDIDHMIVSAVERYESCPRRVRMHLTALKMKNGVVFGDLENLGGTEPNLAHFHANPETKVIRYFDVEHTEGTVGSFTDKVVSKGAVPTAFNATGVAVSVVTLGIVLALKRGGFDLESSYNTFQSGYNNLMKHGGSIADYFNISSVPTGWLHTNSAKAALKRIQDNAAEEYGGPFGLSYSIENDATIGRGAKVGCTGKGQVITGNYTHSQLIDKTDLTLKSSFRNHTHHGKVIDNTAISYTPREEYNTRIYAGDRSGSQFGFDTLEYDFRGVNTGFEMAVDTAGTFWRNATPTRVGSVEGEGDAIAMEGRLFAVYDYSVAQWKWVRGDTSLLS